MKTVLCYGDSLTWGYNAEDTVTAPDRRPLADGAAGSAWQRSHRHCGRAERPDHRLRRSHGRLRPQRRTPAAHRPCHAHRRSTWSIIMLGANDMKPFISGYAFGSKQGIERLVEIVRHHAYAFAAEPPQVLIVSPPPLSETADRRFRRYVRRRHRPNRESLPASIARSRTGTAAASSMPARSPRPRRSTASISTPKTPVRSARRWRRWQQRCWGFDEMGFVNDGALRLHPHPLPLPTRGRGFRLALRFETDNSPRLDAAWIGWRFPPPCGEG